MNRNIWITVIVLIAIAAGAYFMLRDRWGNAATTNNQMPINVGENLPVEPAAQLARLDLASKLGIDEEDILIMEASDMTWNDGCLGLGKANESCLQALVPGFRIELDAEGETYVYRTDKTGGNLRAED